MIIISIIIPIYKVEAYIKRCLESVMIQTWNYNDGEIECILVDDCTPDNSMVIAIDMIKAYKGNIQFTCQQHEKNRGLSAARNTGMANAKGAYILFIDSDDYITPNCLLKYVEYIKKYPNADLFIGQVMKSPNKDLYFHLSNKLMFMNDKNQILNLFFSRKLHIEAWNKLIKRKILQEEQLHFIEGIYFEDIPWEYHLFTYINSIVIIPEVTYMYRINPEGIMATSTKSDKIEKSIQSRTAIIKLLLKNPPDKKFSSNIIIEYMMFVHSVMIEAMHLYPGKMNRHIFDERKQLLILSLKKGRLSLVALCLLLFKPFNYMFNYHLFRKNYYYIRKSIRILSHLTDFIHQHH